MNSKFLAKGLSWVWLVELIELEKEATKQQSENLDVIDSMSNHVKSCQLEHILRWKS